MKEPQSRNASKTRWGGPMQTRIVISGALANKCGNGGGTWERMSWVVGLARLGYEAYFVEEISARACVDAAGLETSFGESVNLAWFRAITEWFGVAERSALVYAGGKECAGVSWPRLLEIARSADLLVNLSGHLTLDPLLSRVRRKAYIDVDPGFTQFWHADPETPFRVARHDDYYTIGENIGSPNCPIPVGGIRWRPIRQPVILAHWPVARTDTPPRFTTIASWRGPFGPVQFGGKTYGLKVHEFRKFLSLPGLAVSGSGLGARSAVAAEFEIALDIDPGDANDLAALQENGWQIVDPRSVAGDADSFRRYIEESGAEFSVAQGIYVDTNSGWFSDRTVRYLASGKPALVQETGFSRHIPTGLGLISFRTLDEALAGAEAITSDYDRHCQSARQIAEEYFDSDKVLGRMMEEVGAMP